MRLLRRLLFRSRRARLERELIEEMDFHRSMKLVENAGAADLTSRQMGNTTLAIEDSRASWSFPGIERLWQDLRYAGDSSTCKAAACRASSSMPPRPVFRSTNSLALSPNGP